MLMPVADSQAAAHWRSVLVAALTVSAAAHRLRQFFDFRSPTGGGGEKLESLA